MYASAHLPYSGRKNPQSALAVHNTMQVQEQEASSALPAPSVVPGTPPILPPHVLVLDTEVEVHLPQFLPQYPS